MNCDSKKKYESIAKELNITAGAAAKRFERASKNLQTLLHREYPDSL
jgi:DNA-directed RNA polymerase specialized sigma24 family protein